ncbi:hypothetical protein PF005_g14566 [Phytophthora fragariae]|uniref:Uncharacterized protein n=1 Tax=Phytophthora fragariae TaxID=53985 RepID=A0A6A3YIS1_9STRA|nr:hypothetical protein PF003_g38323 [Phytophthora fragariae]KAE8934038.1 hypothetical protein PF009_g15973 [Phytophthora fragariae]KAE9101829.1 hypothetical protein PF007_g14982 [Phytophthora fragariae]KAE9139312.1 hypothetical protein PF006_g13773 [Phytophthora fragariae]KAE9202412.1 hypothetical protein PF005_g14566 [Phytophthora fragariae]
MVAKRTHGSGEDASNDDKGKGHDDLPVRPRAATPAGAAPATASASPAKLSTQPVQAVSASSIGAAKHDSKGGKSSGEGGAAGPAALAGPASASGPAAAAPAAGPAGSGPPARAPAVSAPATFSVATEAAAAPKTKRKRTQTSRSVDKRLRRFSPHEADRSTLADSLRDPTSSEVDDFEEEEGGVVEDADAAFSDTEALPAHLTSMEEKVPRDRDSKT